MSISASQAFLHSDADPPLGLGAAHRLSEQVGITMEILNGRERDRVDTLLDGGLSGGGKSGDSMSERSDKIAETVGRQCAVDPAVSLRLPPNPEPMITTS